MRDPRKLTKSRFKLAMECPRKLVYHGDPAYHDASSEDDFLKGLADCGHQVGAFARLLFPGGVEITARDQQEQLRLTREAMAQDSVVLFEPTFTHGNCLVRVDVLVKEGNAVQLIEVKSKSLKAQKGFLGEKGQITSEWRPYLLDVAFQTHVLRSSHPELRVDPYLMLVDPEVTNPIPHLGALFRVHREGTSVDVAVDPTVQAAAVPRLLRLHPVDAEVAVLLGGDIDGPEGGPLPFAAAVDAYASALLSGQPAQPRLSGACKKCQFYCEPVPGGASLRSGWAECVEIATRRPAPTSRNETIFGLRNDKKIEKRLEAGTIPLADLDASAIPFDGEKPGCISQQHRQWLQCEEARAEVDGPVLSREAVSEALGAFRWPLHFIDFETGRYALPLHAGTTPNELLLYQYSEHVLEQDGSLRHNSHFLCSAAGVNPNRVTLDALRQALSGDGGTVIHWWDHERIVLEELRESLDPMDSADRERIAFINELCGDGASTPGRLFDLGRLFQRAVYLPGTHARSSIKKVLPAVLRLAPGVRARFATPDYGTPACPSLNITGPFAWVRRNAAGDIEDPYTLLPRFSGNVGLYMDFESADDSDAAAIVNGGAAMLAYASLQDPALGAAKRQDVCVKMLRYTELDSLAMVMGYLALVEWGGAMSATNDSAS